MNKHAHSSQAQGGPIDRIASIGYRYSIWSEFEKRVRDEFSYRGNYIPTVVHKHPYSFKSLKVQDQEVLIVWQPNKKYPTQKLSGNPLEISYKYTDKTNLVDFNNYYDTLTGPGNHRKTEDSEETFYGNYDKSETYRAVYQLEAKATGDYEGIITNPPYPAKKKRNSLGKAKWLVPAAIGLVTGLAAMPLLRALRAQSGE